MLNWWVGHLWHSRPSLDVWGLAVRILPLWVRTGIMNTAAMSVWWSTAGKLQVLILIVLVLLNCIGKHGDQCYFILHTCTCRVFKKFMDNVYIKYKIAMGFQIFLKHQNKLIPFSRTFLKCSCIGKPTRKFLSLNKLYICHIANENLLRSSYFPITIYLDVCSLQIDYTVSCLWLNVSFSVCSAIRLKQCRESNE